MYKLEDRVKFIVTTGSDIYAAGYQIEETDSEHTFDIPRYLLNGIWNMLPPVEVGINSEVETLLVVTGDSHLLLTT